MASTSEPYDVQDQATGNHHVDPYADTAGTHPNAYTFGEAPQEDTRDAAPALHAAAAPVRYFQVEIFFRSTLTLTYLLYIIVLIGLTIFASSMDRIQLQCFKFGALAGTKALGTSVGNCDVDATVLSTSYDPEIYNVTANLPGFELRSFGGVPENIHSVYFTHPRFSIVLGAALPNGTKIEWQDVPFALNEQLPRLEMLDSNGTFLGSIDDLTIRESDYRRDFAESTQQFIVELPRSRVGNYVATMAGFSMKFAEPLVGNSTLGNMTELLESGWVPVVSVRFFGRKRPYGVFELVFRTICLIGGLISFFVFLNGWLQDRGGIVANARRDGVIDTIVGLIKRFRELPSNLRATLWFHLAITFYCDPLYLGSALLPGNDFFYIWRVHILWNFMNSAVIMYATFVVLASTSIRVIQSGGRRYQVGFCTLMFAVMLTLLDLSAIGVPQTSGKPSAIFRHHNDRAVIYYLFLCLWAFVLSAIMRKYRSQLMWKQEHHRYTGTHRVFVMWLQMMMYLLGLVNLVWCAVIIPILGVSSWLAPLFEDSGVLWIALWMMVSGVGLWLFFPQEYDPALLPPNPHMVVRGKALKARRKRRERERRRSQASDAVAEEMPRRPTQTFGATAGAVDDESGTMQNEFFRDREPSAYVEEEVAEFNQTVTLGASLTDDAEEDSRAWIKRQWGPEHFEAIHRYHISGFFFLTEAEKMIFDGNHRRVALAQSFFCWETAISCLNLSNEVYLEHEDEADIVMLEHEDGCCVSCITSCCLPSTNDGPSCGPGEVDIIEGVDEDEEFVMVEHRRRTLPGPESAGSPKGEDGEDEATPGEGKINVTQHGYRLHKVVVAHDVQAMIVYIPSGPASAESMRYTSGIPQGVRQKTNSSYIRIPQIVIAFRGTCSLSNAVTDIKIGRTVWDESMPNATQGLPKVHAGFEVAWADLRPLIAEHLGTLLDSGLVSPDARIIMTGHSLGGAIAVLCTYSLRKGFLSHLARTRAVNCYTFGSPRLGNADFLQHYNSVCKETYRVVNENDKVTYLGHCGRKHVGRTIVINRDGNYIVEPSVVESVFDPLYGGGSSLKNHSLIRYANCFDTAVKPDTGFDLREQFCSVYRLAEELKQYRSSQPSSPNFGSRKFSTMNRQDTAVPDEAAGEDSAANAPFANFSAFSEPTVDTNGQQGGEQQPGGDGDTTSGGLIRDVEPVASEDDEDGEEEVEMPMNRRVTLAGPSDFEVSEDANEGTAQ